MTKLFFFYFLLIGLNAPNLFAQELDSTFYRKYVRKKVLAKDKNKARFVEIHSLKDSSKTIEVIELKKNKIILREEYKGLFPSGVWISHDEKGKILSTKDFTNLKYKLQSPENQDSIEQHPTLNGSEQGFYDWIAANISGRGWSKNEAWMDFLNEIKKDKVTGKVYFTIKISKTGETSLNGIQRATTPYHAEYIQKIISKMPKAKPALKNSEPIDYYKLIGFSFEALDDFFNYGR